MEKKKDHDHIKKLSAAGLLIAMGVVYGGYWDESVICDESYFRGKWWTEHRN